MTMDPSRGYVPHIDGLRAIAVLSVILFHLDPSWLPGGFTGVDVFFVISGFVVSASVQRLPLLPPGASMLRFYARRMRRIAPALLLCLLLTSVASVLLIPDSWLSEASAKTGRMAFIGFSNWVLAASGNDYFGPRADYNPFTHTWSLGVEEQFYLVFPLLFLGWVRGGRARWVALGLFAVGTAASLGHAAMLGTRPEDATRAFFVSTTRFWQLGAGVLLFQLLHLRTAGAAAAVPVARPARAGWSLLALGALVLLVGSLWSARAGRSPWPDGIAPVAATCALLLALQAHPQGWVGRVLSCAPLRAVGLMSYSLYLWHWPVLVLMRWTTGIESAALRITALALTAALAWVSWRLVERPFRGPLAARWPDRRWVLGGVVALVMGGGLQTLLYKQSAALSLSTVNRHPADWYPDGKDVASAYPDCALVRASEPFAGGQVRRLARGECTRPAAAGMPAQLFVAGDSHAMGYMGLLSRLPLETGITVWLYGRGGCPQVSMQAWRGQGAGCADHDASVRADIAARARPGDVVLLASLRVPRLSEQFALFDAQAQLAGEYSDAAREGRAAEVKAAIALWEPVARSGVRILLEAPKPVLPAPPFRCSDRFNAHNPICARGLTTPRGEMEHYRAPVLQSLHEVAAGLPGAQVWDPLPVLCDADRCGPSRDGRPVFFDGDHLSGYGNRLLLPSLLKAMAPARLPGAPPGPHSGS